MNYRPKIYTYYSSNRVDKLAPETVKGFKSREPYLKKIIRDHFPKNKGIKMLEVGCGHGAFQYYIQQAGYTNSIGIDGSKEQVQEAHRLIIKNVIQADMFEYLRTIEYNSIDLLIAIDVIEHFTKEELSDLADEFFRVLKAGGKMICHTTNGDSPFGSSIFFRDYTHELSFTRQSIAQLFLASGFSAVESYENKPIPHGLKSMVRYMLWEYVVRNIYRFLIVVETGACDKNAILTQSFLTVATK